ncbi:uncharacterized protein VTP21DRAFT_10355 [Calcarisporiella thermophila]|uniref:uncharacterized protein n=1 Tax=Calcarisporiella thermophila TaxID=911321 RepID=UPI003743F2E5
MAASIAQALTYNAAENTSSSSIIDNINLPSTPENRILPNDTTIEESPQPQDHTSPQDSASSPQDCSQQPINTSINESENSASVPYQTRHASSRRDITSSNSKVASSKVHPRWHNQSYMLFLALRQSKASSMFRTELCRAALAMDEKISQERGLPRVFRGKARS